MEWRQRNPFSVSHDQAEEIIIMKLLIINLQFYKTLLNGTRNPLVRHRLSVYPDAQVHMYLLIPSIQVPLWEHGELAQSLTSVARRKIIIRDNNASTYMCASTLFEFSQSVIVVIVFWSHLYDVTRTKMCSYSIEHFFRKWRRILNSNNDDDDDDDDDDNRTTTTTMIMMTMTTTETTTMMIILMRTYFIFHTKIPMQNGKLQ